jgi:cobalt/nickel transport system permease protein
LFHSPRKRPVGAQEIAIMHIEPGQLAATTIFGANIAASTLLIRYTPTLLRQPALWLRTLLAAGFFSVLMQAYHLPVGPSELHLIGAMPIYLLFGFLPTLFGFALGLLAQGLIFEPQDLIHLGVNALSLMLPLAALHVSVGRRLGQAAREGNIAALLKLDAFYYTGVTLMVGFWLSQARVATPFAAWAHFAASYTSLVVLEPVLTYAALYMLARHLTAHAVPAWARRCLDEKLTQRTAS